MKRSEAISKIKEEIKALLYLYSIDSGRRLDADADSLLGFFEYDLCMLPPLQKNLDMHTEPYQWEPENETTQTSNP